MIRLEGVSRRYGDTIAVDGLSMEVGEGEVCVVIGPSGCGKTTTLRMINRLIEPTSGRIFVNGKDTGNLKPERLRQSMGYAIQSVGLFPHMTVAANIAVVPELVKWDRSRIARRVDELLTLVGLSPADYARKYPSQLSGGEAQRVGVARALAADPPILLMDEPFGAVDPLTREKLQAQFVRIQQELRKTVILVTHDLDEAIRLADRIAIMEAGRLQQYDTPETLLSAPANKFVHDFVGADRALKRLSRMGIEDFIEPSPAVSASASTADAWAAMGVGPSVWVLDGEGHLLGWVDRAGLSQVSSIGQALVAVDADELALTKSATLREALSRMLGYGVKNLPVVDDRGQLIGEVSLGDVEAATSEFRSVTDAES